MFAVTLGPLALLLFVCASAAAQGPLNVDRPRDPARPPATRPEPIEPQKIITLDEALAMAESQNPQLRAAFAAVEGAQAGILTARAYRNPEINIGGFGGQRALLDTAIAGGIAGFVFTQPLELPSLRNARIQAARSGREGTGFALSESRLAVRATVKQAFFQVLRRKGELELARGNLQLLEDLRRRISVQVDAGEAARLELIRAEAEVAAARIQLQSSDLRLSGARSALFAAIGAPITTQLDPQGELDGPAALPSLDTLRKEVLASHPAIQQAEAQRRRAGALLNVEEALKKPQPTLWADMFRQPDAAQYRVGVSVTLPLWNRREGPIAEAVAAERQAIAVADLRRIEISAAVERAYNLYEVADQQVRMFESGTLLGAEAAVKGAEAAFRFGERGIIEVLDAQRVLRAARMDFLNAQFDRQAALIELEQLGVLNLGNRRP